MLPFKDLFPYQLKAVEFQCDRAASALWLDMGLGKTVITLTSISHMLNCGYLSGVIVVAPIRVCRLVWRQEALKWQHTSKLRFGMVVGDKDQRLRALTQKADIYLINYENLEWLVETLNTYFVAHGRPLPANGIVFDEISKCKNSSTHRVRALTKMLPQFIWRTGLTGTPAGNGYKDLHGQYLVLDGGQRLGVSKVQFESRWYHKEGPYKRVPYADTEEQLKKIVGDITLEMSAEDYNPLPDIIINDVTVELPEELRGKYEQMEREFFMVLESGAEVELFNKAALTNKCLQFANGAVYPVAGMPLWEPLHDLKLDALEEILDEANGQPVLCSYAFRSDAERIMKRFHKLRPINLTECKSERSLRDAMDRWVRGDCPLMIGHPGSMGHGIDGLQKRGHILVWFGLNWSLDLYDQFNARIRRQGQGAPVICHRILCADTLDQAQSLALDGKAKTQAGLRKAIKEYWQNKHR
jgi:SNF2 family DNA or RNA helicase